MLPAPYQPADVDLSAMPFMPLDINRIRRSRAHQIAHSDPAGGYAMRLLWDDSWLQKPAGSLEDDDLLLAAAAGCTRADWNKRRAVALYGWVKCSDGRLYHPVICAIAWKTWHERLKVRHKMACDRTRLSNKRKDEHRRAGRTDVEPNEVVLAFEPWVRKEFPASAAKLFAAATPSAPVPTAKAAANVAATTGNVAATGGGCRSDNGQSRGDSGLKDKDKDKGNISPLTPLAGTAATDQPAEGEEWQRAADFAAYMLAVDQPDAPLRTCWMAWLDVVRDLPERRVLLAQVAAWKARCRRDNEGQRHQRRPLGPARLLREGTLNAFAEEAERLLADEAALTFIDLAEQERADAAREAWGDLFPALLKVAGSNAIFVAWFGQARPIWDGETLIIGAPKAFQVNWINEHFRDGVARELGRQVEVRQVFEQRGAS